MAQAAAVLHITYQSLLSKIKDMKAAGYALPARIQLSKAEVDDKVSILRKFKDFI